MRNKFQILSGVQLELDWADFKKYIDGAYKKLLVQYTERTVKVREKDEDKDISFYQLIALDDRIVYACEVAKTIAPEDGSDQVDFETNFKPSANKQLSK